MTAIQGTGIHDPVFGSQIIFRHILSAMASPGLIVKLPQGLCGQPDGVSPAAAAILLTLCDYETPTLIDSTFYSVGAWLRFYTGTEVTDDPKQARFAWLDGSKFPVTVDRFHMGDDRYPDQSTTIVIECSSCSGGPRVRLTGPGIQSAVDIAPSGLAPHFWQEASRNHQMYPLGVDFILAAGHEFLALPRSTRIEEID